MAGWAEETESPEESGKDPPTTCWEKFHTTVSNWMLPPDRRMSYMERANCLPPPIFIISISIIELGVFIYYAVWMPQKQWITLDTGITNSPFIYRPDKREEAWRFVSYMLVHAGVQHIIGNLFLQLFLGIPLEMVHKGHRVGLVYIAGVIGDMVPLFGMFRILGIVLIVGTDVGFALYRRYISKVAGPQVSFVAHFAGGLAGMSIGYTVFSCFDKNLIKDPRFWICIAAYVAFLAFAVFFNIFLSPVS
ncbi:hypothetical protein GDO78_001071 [Eleutherodactylus coqui]|uniref:rhomboid protease n=1 Tax=Eleutherodactylus coqui TaxID=57060 RepID=A0A8J6FS02_ELECQ|nr:hypothetical protein GDO78_001071 [Eleutherodactylus coqui]